MGRRSPNNSEEPAERTDFDVRAEELSRNLKISTDLIKKTTNLNHLLDLILKEYEDRFDEIPGADLSHSHDMADKSEVSEKMKSLIMFASQAVVLKENAEIFYKLDRKNEELRRSARKQKKQNAQLKTLNDQYLSMLGFVSHEFRSPLISILGFAELLDEEMLGKLNPEQKRAVSMIIRSCRTLNDLIQNYLDLAKIEEGRLVLERSSLDLHKDILIMVLEEMTEQFNKKDLSVWVEADSEPIYVNCDPVLIRIVFNNLLSNAVKYSNENGHVRILVTNHDKEYMISVINSGPGLKKTQLRMLFKKFSQIDIKKDINTQSSGLGLYNAMHIIEKHGGRIWADSEPGESFTITFTLPASMEQSQPFTATSMAG